MPSICALVLFVHINHCQKDKSLFILSYKDTIFKKITTLKNGVIDILKYLNFIMLYEFDCMLFVVVKFEKIIYTNLYSKLSSLFFNTRYHMYSPNPNGEAKLTLRSCRLVQYDDCDCVIVYLSVKTQRVQLRLNGAYKCVFPFRASAVRIFNDVCVKFSQIYTHLRRKVKPNRTDRRTYQQKHSTSAPA